MPVEMESPERTSLITNELLTLALTTYHRSKKDIGEDESVRVTRFQCDSNCDACETALSDIYPVSVFYRLPSDTDGGEDHRLDLVSKQLPMDPFARYFVKEARFDTREIMFYTRIVPDMEAFLAQHFPLDSEDVRLPIPKCYYASAGQGGAEDETVILLENLKITDFQSPDLEVGLELKQAESAVECVAKMHALSLAMRHHSGQPPDQTYPFLFQADKASRSYQLLVERGLPQLEIFLRQRNLLGIFDKIVAMRARTKAVVKTLLCAGDSPVAAITHTDFWCNNLLFRGDGECVILDWQMVTHSKPTNDLALLIITSLSPQLRRNHTQHLLKTYWEALTRFRAKLSVPDLRYDLQRLKADYKASQLLAILLCIGSIDVALGNAAAEERLVQVLQDLDAEGIFSPENVEACAK